MWLSQYQRPQNGAIFDRVELTDDDSDGDLDLLTCEERDNPGVISYDNPWLNANH